MTDNVSCEKLRCLVLASGEGFLESRISGLLKALEKLLLQHAQASNPPWKAMKMMTLAT